MNILLRLLIIAGFCVTSGVVEAGDYIDNSDGTVTDNKTRLTWQKGEQEKMRWENARAYCSSMNLGGYSDWRLPLKSELLTLIERNKFNPSIDRKFFPEAQPDDYWTMSQGTVGVGSAAWLVHFGYGDTHFFNKSNNYLVRCVR